MYRYRSGANQATNPRAYAYPDGMAQTYNSYSVDKLSQEMVQRMHHSENLGNAWERVVNEVFTPGRKLMLQGQLKNKPENGMQNIGLFEVKETNALSSASYVKLVKRQGAELFEGETPQSEFLLLVQLSFHTSDAPPISDSGPQCYTLTGKGEWSSDGIGKPYKHGAYWATLWYKSSELADVCLGFSESWSTVQKRVPVMNALNRWYTDASQRTWAPGGLAYKELHKTYEDGFDKRLRNLQEQQAVAGEQNVKRHRVERIDPLS